MMNDLNVPAEETTSMNFWAESEIFAPLKKCSGAKSSTSMRQALTTTQKLKIKNRFSPLCTTTCTCQRMVKQLLKSFFHVQMQKKQTWASPLGQARNRE